MFYKVSNGFGRKCVFTDDVKVATVEFKKLVAEGAEIVEMMEYTENSKGIHGVQVAGYWHGKQWSKVEA